MTLFAAADLGSNTFRLVIARFEPPSSLREVALHQRVVRLGQGLGLGGAMREEALKRAEACLEEFGAALRSHGASRVFAAMTAAGRDLSGGGRVASVVREKLGAVVTVPTGEEEAALSHAGATALLGRSASPTLLMDIGGGSTEIAAVGQGQGSHWESMRLGVVRLTEEMRPPSPAGAEGFQALKRRAAEVMENTAFAREAESWRNLFADGGATLLSNAGTPLTLAAMKTGIPPWETRRLSGVELTSDEVHSAAEFFSSLTTGEIRDLPAIAEGREDVILSGVAILSAFMEFVGAGSVTVSDGGLCEGLLLREAAKTLGVEPCFAPM